MNNATEQRRLWAYSLIRKASSPPPSYGSPDWWALPEGSDLKVASVVIAAECWATEADDVEDRLCRELDDERHAFKRAEDDDYRARAAAHRQQWKHLSVVPARYVSQQVRPLEDIGAEHTAQLRESRR